MILDNCPHTTGLFHPDRCPICEHDQEVAQEIFGDTEHTILDYMVTSAGSVGYAPSHCERCKKKFRFWRKEHHIYDREAHMFHRIKSVCIDCINLETDTI